MFMQWRPMSESTAEATNPPSSISIVNSSFNLLQSVASKIFDLTHAHRWVPRVNLQAPKSFDIVSHLDLASKEKRLEFQSDLCNAVVNLDLVVPEIAECPGAFSDVYKCSHSGEAVCLKVMRAYKGNYNRIDHLLKEANVWSQLNHPNLLPFYGISNYNGRLSFVTPWMENGNISQYIKHNTTSNRATLTLDVGHGLNYLHGQGIVHGNLKGSNVLVDYSGKAYIADFSLPYASSENLSEWSSPRRSWGGGTVRFQAPELFDFEGDKEMPPSKASDIYAWASVCYEIFTSEIPFAHLKRDMSIIIQVSKGIRPAQPPKSSSSWSMWGLTEEIWALMELCWSALPQERPTSNEIIRCSVLALPSDLRPDGTDSASSNEDIIPMACQTLDYDLVTSRRPNVSIFHLTSARRSYPWYCSLHYGISLPRPSTPYVLEDYLNPATIAGYRPRSYDACPRAKALGQAATVYQSAGVSYVGPFYNTIDNLQLHTYHQGEKYQKVDCQALCPEFTASRAMSIHDAPILANGIPYRFMRFPNCPSIIINSRFTELCPSLHKDYPIRIRNCAPRIYRLAKNPECTTNFCGIRAESYWIAEEILGLPSKTQGIERGAFYEADVHNDFADLGHFVSSSYNIVDDCHLRFDMEGAFQGLLRYAKGHIDQVHNEISSALLQNGIDNVLVGNTGLNLEFAVRVILVLKESRSTNAEFVAYSIATLIPTVAHFSEVIAYAVDFYLSEDKQKERAEIVRLSDSIDKENTRKILVYVSQVLYVNSPQMCSRTSDADKLRHIGSGDIGYHAKLADVGCGPNPIVGVEDPSVDDENESGLSWPLFESRETLILAYETSVPVIIGTILALKDVKRTTGNPEGLARFKEKWNGFMKQLYIDEEGKVAPFHVWK